MTAAELLAMLRSKGVQVRAENGELRYDAPSDVMNPEVTAYVKRHSAELLRELIGVDDSQPLSLYQQRLWFLQQLDPANPFLNVIGAVRVRGSLDSTLLRTSLRHVVARHEQLRVTVEARDNEPRQVIRSLSDESLLLTEYLDVAAGDRSDAIATHAASLARKPLNLAESPLFRFVHLRFADDDHAFILLMHHIICDFDSIGIILRDLLSRYRSGEGTRPAADGLLSYSEAAARSVAVGSSTSTFDYWKHTLSGCAPIDLPFSGPRSSVKSFSGASYKIVLEPSTYDAVLSRARSLKVTPFCLLLGVFAACLHRLGAGEDIVVGTDVSGRDSVQIADVVGFLVNQVPLRLRPKSNVTFSQLVQATAATLGEALSHARVPFQQVVESLGSSRDAGRHPLFDVAFTAHSAPLLSGSQAPLEMQVIDVPCHSALLDLEVLVQFREQDVLLNWRYDTHLFAEQSIARIARSFVNLVRSASNSPESVLGSLPLAAPSDIAEAYRVGLGPVCDGAAQTVVDALASVTRERGSSTAVVDELGTLTYSGLFEAVERYATGLVGAGVEAGDVVAVCLERSSRLLIAMLGAFRVGAIHLAIDPRFPPARIARMVTRSRCRLLVSTHSLEGQTRALRDVNVLDYSSITRGGTATLPKPPSADAPAYVIFTSGSTGEPKGAVVGHRGMFNHLRAKIEDLRLSVGDTCLQTASQGFDISVWQFLASLLAGGRLVIVPAAVAEDPRALWSTVQEQQAAMLQTVPSMLSAILDEVEAHGLSTCPLRWLISTGEALPPELARRWLRHFPQIPLVNAYGPAECSDDVTHAFITAPQDQRCAHMPIGKPIRGAQLIVVNERLEPLPVGLAGELVVAGVVVGHGYMRSPRDSARAFVPDFFSGVASARCYRTGDVVRWNAAGELEFLCRVDQQVKLRGMRVDLGEIEAAILGFGDCRAAVVVPMRRGATVASLMACVVPKHSGGIAESGLLEKLSSLLPPYMIPAQLHVFADLPINANGKVDRQLLQKMVEPRDSPQTLTATASYAESLVADLWAELLKVPRADIGRESDFFLLGGHSILAARLVRRLEDVASTTVPLALVFQQTKLAAFAQRLLLVPHRAGA